MKKLKQTTQTIYQWANKRTGGLVDLLGKAFQHFSEVRAREAAAGLAYYALFSLFPLLLILVAVGSFFLKSEQAFQEAVTFVTEAIPVSRTLIERNVSRVLERRGTIGVIGVIGLLWSSSGFFTLLVRNIGRAWPESEPRGFLRQRLVALTMVGTLALLLILSLLSTTLLNVLPRLEIPLRGGISIYQTTLWRLLSNLIPWFLVFALFLALYRWVPNGAVSWTAAFWGAVLAAIAWEAASSIFAWYLGTGLIQYELIYGSLGTVVALMIWIYISNLIILFGAHLSAAIDQRE
jgi:membrane protein